MMFYPVVVFNKLDGSTNLIKNNYGIFNKKSHIDAVRVLSKKLELQSSENMNRGPPLKF